MEGSSGGIGKEVAVVGTKDEADGLGSNVGVI